MQYPKSNSEFLKALFGDDWSEIPVSSGASWGVMPATSVDLFMPTMANYYCVSSFNYGGGRFRRKKEIFKRQNIVVLDDIGTKLDQAAVELLYPPPTYKLETSPGNFQWGYRIKGGCDDIRKAEALVEAIIENEMVNPSGKDPGMANVTRVVRLPFGANVKDSVKANNGGKPFPCRLTEWSPDVEYTVADLASIFGADLSDAALDGRKVSLLSGEASVEEVEGDFILKLFRARGMVTDESRSDAGFITVECPWADGHTDPRREAGYRPGLNGFQCHHGGCLNRTMEDLRAWASEVETTEERVEKAAVAFPKIEDADDAEADAEAERKRAEERAKFGHAVYIEKLGLFGMKKTGCLFDSAKFNGANPQIAPAGTSGKKSASALFINSEYAERAYTATYAPGSPQITTQEMNGVKVTAFNTWVPGPIKAHSGPVSDADIAIWLDHVALLLADKEVRELFLDFAAFLFQRPGQKINWGCLFQGAQGIGKDAMTLPLTRILGAHNVRQVGVKALESDFNDHLKTQLVIIEELPPYHKKDIYETLKALVSTGQGFIRINEKNQPPYWIPNTQNYIVFSNHKDALAIEKDDRRFLIYFSPMVKQTPAYYDALFAALNDPTFLAKVHRWLLTRDISKFNPMAAPPMTDSKKFMAAAARGSVEEWVDEQLGPDGQFADRRLITVDEILKAADRGGSGNIVPFAVARKITARLVADTLKERGAVQFDRFRSTTGQRLRLWAVKSPELFRQMTTEQLDALYQKEIKSELSEELKAVF